VVSALLSLERSQSMLFRRLPDRARFSRAPEALVVLDDEGHLRRGLVAGVTTEPGPTIGCGWLVPPGAARTIPLEVRLYRWFFTAALRYQVPSATRVEVGLDGRSRTLTLDPGASSVHVPVGGGGRSLHVANHGDAPLCVRGAAVGVAVPTGDPL
jgi:hypothetical protein